MPTRFCHGSRLLSDMLALACFVVASCAVDDAGQAADVGLASVALSGVPNDVRCVRIDIDGPSRSASRKFAVMPGGDAKLTVTAIQLGMVSFSGQAFSKICDAVSGDASGEWSAETVTVQVVPGEPASVHLVMRRSGKASVDVSFDECDDAGTSNVGEACGSCGGVVECNGSCSIPTPANFGQACGACGGVVLCDGTCSIATPPDLGAACGGCGGTIQCDGSCSMPQVAPTCGVGRMCCETDECGRCSMCATLCP